MPKRASQVMPPVQYLFCCGSQASHGLAPSAEPGVKQANPAYCPVLLSKWTSHVWPPLQPASVTGLQRMVGPPPAPAPLAEAVVDTPDPEAELVCAALAPPAPPLA